MSRAAKHSRLPFARNCSIAASLLMLPLLAGGCVQQEQYDSLLMSNRSLQEQVVTLEDERDAARANIDTMRAQLSQATAELAGLRQRYNLSEDEMRRLALSYDDLMKQVQGLEFGPLPEDMSAALAQLAAENPNLLTFDARRGMLRFASDFTFGLGSADLTSGASESIAQLARILSTPTAASFEARIVGHTDNVPISQPATRAKHPTNWHLSAHRAISVGSALISNGVNPQRVQVAGYGEYRPVVANPARGGAAQNRRVEIFIVPMPADLSPAAPAAIAQPTNINNEPMK